MKRTQKRMRRRKKGTAINEDLTIILEPLVIENKKIKNVNKDTEASNILLQQCVKQIRSGSQREFVSVSSQVQIRDVSLAAKNVTGCHINI